MENKIKKLRDSISKQEPNYFGMYIEEIYKIQLELCLNSKCTIPDNVDVVAYIFWNKYFGSEKEVKWYFFKKYFNQEFFPYVHIENKFKEILCENYLVKLDKYFDLTRDGIYELYQKVSDYNTTIYYLNENNELRYDTTLLGQHIISISSGGDFAAALTKEGHVYVKGHNDFGQLGIPGGQTTHFEPNRFFFCNDIRVKKIVCGYAYTGAITFDDKLYMWGAGENGRLGNGLTINTYVPTKISVNVKDVQVGSTHTCFLTNDGKVYTFGKSYFTGINTHTDILTPTLLPFNEQIQSISIGGSGYHTMALTVTNKLYTWGQNRVGQLGIPKVDLPVNSEKASYSPVPIHVKDVDSLNIININAFWANSVITCKNGDVYVCGKNINIPINTKFEINERGDSYLDKFTKINVKNIHFDQKKVVIIKSEFSTDKVIDVAFGSKYKMFLIQKYKLSNLQNVYLNKFNHFDFCNIIKSYLLPSDTILIC